MNILDFLNYPIYLAIYVCIYGILAIGLNIQWGYAGLFNAGIAGFFAIGAYTSAILTSPDVPDRLGGFDLPVAVGIIAAMLISAATAWPIGKICLRFRGDYLAIVTFGVAEAIGLVSRSSDWLTGSTRGVNDVPRPFGFLPYAQSQVAFLLLAAAILLVVFLLVERQSRSPWGRMMRAIRDNEVAASAMGKAVQFRRLQAFILGAALMGLGGAVYVHLVRSMNPDAVDPMIATFLIWIMVVLGGAGNNRGVLLGTLVVWVIWSASELVTDLLPTALSLQAKYGRIFLIGLLLQVVLRFRPEGILPERPAKPPQGRR